MSRRSACRAITSRPSIPRFDRASFFSVSMAGADLRCQRPSAPRMIRSFPQRRRLRRPRILFGRQCPRRRHCRQASSLRISLEFHRPSGRVSARRAGPRCQARGPRAKWPQCRCRAQTYRIQFCRARRQRIGKSMTGKSEFCTSEPFPFTLPRRLASSGRPPGATSRRWDSCPANSAADGAGGRCRNSAARQTAAGTRGCRQR